MPRPSLLGLILRLVAGFIILAVLGYLLFNRLRRPAPNRPTPTPTTSPAVTAPSPSPTGSPAVEPTSTPQATATPQPRGTPKKNTQTAKPRTIIIHSDPPVYLIVHPGVKYNVDTEYRVEERK